MPRLRQVPRVDVSDPLTLFFCIVCLYEMHATVSRVLLLEFDDRPEPIVEVDAPEGYGTRDIAADISGPG